MTGVATAMLVIWVPGWVPGTGNAACFCFVSCLQMPHLDGQR